MAPLPHPDSAAFVPELVATPHGQAPVQWRRSPRARRVSLRIDPRAGAVVVTLPLRAGRRQGLDLLQTHAAWVMDRLSALPPASPFVPGAIVPVGGRPHRIVHLPGLRGVPRLSDGVLEVAGDQAHVPRRVADFLRQEARRRITALALAKADAVGRRVPRITIKDTRSRWGSCAPDGSLAFSWRLVLAPAEVLEYVVAHEAAHLVHMNHGPRFWALCAKLSPHAEPAKAWLSAHGARLLRYG
jgi:predicted metal-dependent hydrolase